MSKLSPFIPVVKQVANKVKRANPGLKVPAWYQPPSLTKPTGKFNPGNFQEGGEAPARGHFNKGGFQEREVAKASGAFNKGGYKDPEEEIVDPDPWGAYYFSLEIDNVEVAHFMECSGLKTSAEVFEIEEGGYLASTHKRTGRSKWDNIVLKRAVYKGHLFEEWRDYYMQPPTDGWSRRAETSAAIVMRSNDGEELRRYSILQPWPVSWEGPQLSSGGSDLALESLEIAHEGLVFGRPNVPEVPPEIPPTEPPPAELDGLEFDVNKSDIREGSDMQAADAWGDHANNQEKKPILYVTGHTSTTGSKSSNQILSQGRADEVKRYLKEEKGVTNEVIAIGYGETRLKVKTADNVENQANRRVEIYEDNNPYANGGNPHG